MLTVHHLENSRSQRVLWLLEELHVRYEVKRYDRDPETSLAPDSLRAIHPLGKSPVIEDGEDTIAETGAIFEYLLETYDRGHAFHAKPGTQARRGLTYWLHYAEGSAMTPLLLKLVFSSLPERSPTLLKPLIRSMSNRIEDGFVDPRILGHIEYWESALSATGWFVGERFSAADIMMSFPLEGASARMNLDGYQNIARFLKACRSRPAYQAALETGGPYAYA
ncbi:MAG: glutathione S-transferase [Pseudomonadota bacterium]